MKVGIDSLSYFIPNIHLPIQTLAVQRNIDPLKLIKGLGLKKMALLDTDQDVITMASNAAYNLLKDNNITNTKDIAKLYVGTESSLDNSKPIASYVLGLLEQVFGQDSFLHCDAVDHTFACIGGVDAMQNAIDFVKANPNQKAIVIATDNAKYDLESTGEYTQGAGAIALLITSNPRMISFESQSGVSTKSVFDFFKPYHQIDKKLITNSQDNQPWFDVLEQEICLFKEQPVFDGQYSNACYIERICQAYNHYKQVNQIASEQKPYENWKAILMHLPYCYQARRTFFEIILQENPHLINPDTPDVQQQIKAFSKSKEYLDLIESKIAPSELASAEVGNIYTGSIFLALLSTLTYLQEKNDLSIGEKLGFIAYGSGSKSKVFQGILQPNWTKAMPKTSIFKALEQSHEIDFQTYLQLHKKELKKPIIDTKKQFVLDYIQDRQIPTLQGARYYKFVE
ncbi:hydroxymethylglutaryl-CoA synthase family protein [Myroides sp. LJL119]